MLWTGQSVKRHHEKHLMSHPLPSTYIQETFVPGNYCTDTELQDAHVLFHVTAVACISSKTASNIVFQELRHGARKFEEKLRPIKQILFSLFGCQNNLFLFGSISRSGQFLCALHNHLLTAGELRVLTTKCQFRKFVCDWGPHRKNTSKPFSIRTVSVQRTAIYVGIFYYGLQPWWYFYDPCFVSSS